MDSLTTSLTGAFRRSAVFHLRPRFRTGYASDPPVVDPHGKPPYGFWRSLLKVGYYVLVYAAGYLLVVRPRLVRSTLVVFDRYFDDLLVDPRRLRYGGPPRLVGLAHRLVPAPDLYLILDVPEAELLARKREVSPDEARRQRFAYRRLAACRGERAMLLDGSLPREEVVRAAMGAIVRFLRQRSLDDRRLGVPNARPSVLEWLTSVLCAPAAGAAFELSNASRNGGASRAHAVERFAWLRLRDGRGYLFPLKPRAVAVAGLQLYNTQNLKARLARVALAAGMRAGIAGCVLRGVHLVVRHDGPGPRRDRGLLVDYLRGVLGRDDLHAAISLGTPGPFRKPVVQVLSGAGTTLAFAKVGSDERTNALVEREAATIAFLAKSGVRGVRMPRVLHAGWWGDHYVCVQSPSEGRTHRQSGTLSAPLWDALEELAMLDVRRQPLQGSEPWEALWTHASAVTDPAIRSVLKRGLETARQRVGDALLPFHFSHGDFAPWNLKLSRQHLFVFDWEYATPTGVPAQDLLHYVFQTARYLRGQTPDQIYTWLLRDGAIRARVTTHLASLHAPEIPYEALVLLYRLCWLTREASAGADATPLWTDVRALAEFLDAVEAGRAEPSARRPY